MTQKSRDEGAEKPDANRDDVSIERPRLTPQGRADASGDGEDSTKPGGGVKQGQRDKAEG